MANPSRIPKTFLIRCPPPMSSKTSPSKTMATPVFCGSSRSKSSSCNSYTNYNSKYSNSRFVVGAPSNLICTHEDPQMEILGGAQRVVQSSQMPNPSPIDPQRSLPQHPHGLLTPGKDSISRPLLPRHRLLFHLQPPPLSFALRRIMSMCRR